ncbi:MCE family protein [Gordonia jinghuaiqii]|nr:MCE family protein [Gordonia jinghuaiqii]
MNRRGPMKVLQRIGSSNILLGSTALLVVAIMLATLGILYLRPPAQKEIRFETTDASSISIGQDVRVAGISVGKVTGMSLAPEQVVVRLRVDESTKVGDQSRVEVRMLTPVGGYAVSLIPLGRRTLVSSIPADRVTVPYSIGDVLQSAPTVTDHVDGTDVNANLKQVAAALQGNSTSLESIVDGMGAITEVFDKQRTQVHQVAALAEEYLQSFNANREFIFGLITKIDQVVSAYNNSWAGFNYTYKLLASVTYRLIPFEKYYLENSDELRSRIVALRDGIKDIQEHMGPALDNLVKMRGQFAAWLTPTGMKEIGGGSLWAKNVCVPLAGREC